MKVREAMTPEVEVVSADCPIQEAAARMETLDVGFLPVAERGRLVGVLTDRDIVTRFAAPGLDFSGTTASDVMTREPLYCREDDELEQACEIMERRRVRRLLVLDAKDRLAGLLTLGDVASAAAAEEPLRRVGSVLRRICEPAPEPSTASRRIAMKRNRAGKAVLDGLVKDELAAVETYKRALERLSDAPEAAELRRIENEHEEAATLLQEQVAQMGEEPAMKSEVWRAWESASLSGAERVESRAAITALKEGEQHDLSDYEKALADLTLDQDAKSLIAANLIPKTRAHIPILEQFLGASDGA